MKTQELLNVFHGQAASSTSAVTVNPVTSMMPRLPKPTAAPTQAIGLHAHYDQHLHNLDDIIDKLSLEDFKRIWKQGAENSEDDSYYPRALSDLRTMINCKRALEREGQTDLSEYRIWVRCNGPNYQDAGGHDRANKEWAKQRNFKDYLRFDIKNYLQKRGVDINVADYETLRYLDLPKDVCAEIVKARQEQPYYCLLYTSPSPRD